MLYNSLMITFGYQPPRQSFNNLDDYESWVANDWLYPLGSNEAQRHTRAKLEEEVVELADAFVGGSRDEIISEMGDVLWTAEAVAMNEGFMLEGAVRYSVRGEGMPADTLTLETIDNVARTTDVAWDVPVIKALYGLSDSEVQAGIETGDDRIVRLVLSSLGNELGKSARIVRVLPDPEDGWTRLHEVRAAEALGQIVLLVSYLAQSRCDSTLAEVMTANHDKLAARLANKEPVTKQPRSV